MKYQQKRAIRLKYPSNKRAHIVIENSAYKIINVSQSGAKMIVSKDFRPFIKDWYKITLFFLSGAKLTLKARLVRGVGDIYALHFQKKIPAQFMKDELKQFEKMNIKIETS